MRSHRCMVAPWRERVPGGRTGHCVKQSRQRGSASPTGFDGWYEIGGGVRRGRGADLIAGASHLQQREHPSSSPLRTGCWFPVEGTGSPGDLLPGVLVEVLE